MKKNSAWIRNGGIPEIVRTFGFVEGECDARPQVTELSDSSGLAHDRISIESPQHTTLHVEPGRWSVVLGG
jgi:hypothetical protein